MSMHDADVLSGSLITYSAAILSQEVHEFVCAYLLPLGADKTSHTKLWTNCHLHIDDAFNWSQLEKVGIREKTMEL